ncbi:MAG: hypothetical protein OCD01_00660 [Fibrobacterales bacterium]
MSRKYSQFKTSCEIFKDAITEQRIPMPAQKTLEKCDHDIDTLLSLSKDSYMKYPEKYESKRVDIEQLYWNWDKN